MKSRDPINGSNRKRVSKVSKIIYLIEHCQMDLIETGDLSDFVFLNEVAKFTDSILYNRKSFKQTYIKNISKTKY